jgi:hypothetical protein
MTFDPLRAAHDMPITDDNARNHEYVPRTVGPREFLSVLWGADVQCGLKTAVT